MIARWVLKVVAVIGVVGFVVVELGSPLVTRVQLDGVANDAADDAASSLTHSRDQSHAAATARQVAAARGAQLTRFQVDPATSAVHLTVDRQARSVLFRKWGPLENWYRVEVSASAGRREG